MTSTNSTPTDLGQLSQWADLIEQGFEQAFGGPLTDWAANEPEAALEALEAVLQEVRDRLTGPAAPDHSWTVREVDGWWVARCSTCGWSERRRTEHGAASIAQGHSA